MYCNMTHLETIWHNKHVFVYSMMSKSGKIHSHVKKWVGKIGIVMRESKNNQLLIKFNISTHKRKYISIPPGCVKLLGDEDFAFVLPKYKKGTNTNGNTN